MFGWVIFVLFLAGFVYSRFRKVEGEMKRAANAAKCCLLQQSPSAVGAVSVPRGSLLFVSAAAPDIPQAEQESYTIPRLAVWAVNLQMESLGFCDPSSQAPFQELGPSAVLSKSRREAAAEVVSLPQSPAGALRRGLVPPQADGVLRSPSTPPVLHALLLVQVEAACSGGTSAASVQAQCSRSHQGPRRGGNRTPAALVPGYHCCH